MLTDTKVRAAKAKERAYKLADREGLYLYVSPAGAKSWRFDYRVAGMRETLTIGRYPEKSLADAREDLAQARKMVERGESPARAKQEKRASAKIARANTLQALAEKWYQARAAARSASWRDNTRRWLDKDIVPAIGAKPIREIKVDDVERLIRQIVEKRGAKSAEYARFTLAAVFRSLPRSLAIGNPARDAAGLVEIPKGKPRGRALTAKEIPTFLEAADRYAGRAATKLAIRLLMLTFVRKRELTEAKWDELDLERGEWTIPAERMKAAKPHIVPLSRQAVECFEKLKPLSFGSAYVFPNLGDPKKPMSASTLNMVLGKIGYGRKFTPHGARSTASTMLNAQGWSADAIERQLAHTERNQVRAAYNHGDYMEERRRMMQAWADYLDGLCAGVDVVPIKRKA
jgi:integrase